MAEEKNVQQEPNAENCTHDCSSCGANCSSRKSNKESMLAPANANSKIKKVIGIVSGKGGVGKSLVTCMSAVLARRAGYSGLAARGPAEQHALQAAPPGPQRIRRPAARGSAPGGCFGPSAAPPHAAHASGIAL